MVEQGMIECSGFWCALGAGAGIFMAEAEAHIAVFAGIFVAFIVGCAAWVAVRVCQTITAKYYANAGGNGRRKKSEFPIDPCSIATKEDISKSEAKSEAAHKAIREEMGESEKRRKTATKDSEERLMEAIRAQKELIEAQGRRLDKQGETISGMRDDFADMREKIGELTGVLKK